MLEKYVLGKTKLYMGVNIEILTCLFITYISFLMYACKQYTYIFYFTLQFSTIYLCDILFIWNVLLFRKLSIRVKLFLKILDKVEIKNAWRVSRDFCKSIKFTAHLIERDDLIKEHHDKTNGHSSRRKK